MAADDVDLSEFFEGVPTSGRCTLCELIPKLSDDRRSKLELACSTERVSGARIYAVVNRQWGYGIGIQTVRNHRKEHLASE